MLGDALQLRAIARPLSLFSKCSLKLYSRIHFRFAIGATTPDDTAEYCRYRLQKVGFERELFTHDALTMLHEASSGALRGIDRIASLALRETARRKKKLVERDCIARVIDQDAHAE